MRKQFVHQYVLTVIILFILAFLWEFFLEMHVPFYLYDEDYSELPAERWEYVITVTVFGMLALVVPTMISIQHANRRHLAEKQNKKLTSEQALLLSTIEKEHTLLHKAFTQMTNLIQEVSITGNIALRYENTHLIKCYEKIKCKNTECPCYGLGVSRCWQITGTFCGGEIQSSYAKYENCQLCEVYKNAVSDPPRAIGENFNNMMHILHLKHQELERIYNQLKTAQSLLLQQEKMASIGTLAGGIAHEFNNILAVILGYANIAKMDTPKESGVRADLDNILKAGNRASDLVKQMLIYSRLIEGESYPIRIHHAVKEVLALLEPTIPSSIEVRQNISTDCKNVFANSTMIHQVITNLFTNAVQAMTEKGLIEINMRQITHTGDDKTVLPTLLPGEYIELTISDNGPGIDSTIKDRIFDPFFTTKDVGKGTGMGLSVIYGIVEKLNGLIVVDSEPGEGTSFHVYFPVISEE